MPPVSNPTIPPTPLVSVCIPSFNHERTIRQAIDSVLGQSFRDFEFLVVDDASSDATASIVAAYSDPRLRLVRNPANLGMVRNWNRCLELTSAPFVQFLFADDYLLPGCLDRKVEALSIAPDITLVFSGSRIVDSAGRILLTRKPFARDRVFAGPALARQSFRTRNLFGEPSNVLFRRSFLARTGPFHEDITYSVDWDLWLRLACFGRVAYLADPLSAFRVSRTSVTGSFDWSRFRSDDDAFMARVREAALPVSSLDIAIHRLTQPLRMRVRNLWLRAHLARD